MQELCQWSRRPNASGRLMVLPARSAPWDRGVPAPAQSPPLGHPLVYSVRGMISRLYQFNYLFPWESNHDFVYLPYVRAHYVWTLERNAGQIYSAKYPSSAHTQCSSDRCASLVVVIIGFLTAMPTMTVVPDPTPVIIGMRWLNLINFPFGLWDSSISKIYIFVLHYSYNFQRNILRSSYIKLGQSKLTTIS